MVQGRDATHPQSGVHPNQQNRRPSLFLLASCSPACAARRAALREERLEERCGVGSWSGQSSRDLTRRPPSLRAAATTGEGRAERACGWTGAARQLTLSCAVKVCAFRGHPCAHDTNIEHMVSASALLVCRCA
eukprot:3077326-Rhodomonas_salina.3